MKAELERIKDDATLAINSKMQKIMNVLKEKGLVFDQTLKVQQLMVHPNNRCGMMVSAPAAHSTGFKALQAGFDLQKLTGGYCVELSKDAVTRRMQFQRNEDLIASSDGMLAPLSQNERYLTLGNSHMTQFLRAVNSGCNAMLEDFTTLNPEVLMTKFGGDQIFEQCLKQGWVWQCIASDVEVECPWLPAMLQASLNSSNTVNSTPTEIELAMSVSYWYNVKNSMPSALEMTQSTMPHSNLEAVGHYVQHFAGAPQFGLLNLLSQISKAYGSKHLGEFFVATVCLEFKDKRSLYPFCRTSFLACQLHATKLTDGVARLLLKSDIEKLKSNKTDLWTAESLLALAWETLERMNWSTEKKGISIMAKMMIRTALFLCKKNGKGREETTFAGLNEINQAFMDELQEARDGRQAASSGISTMAQSNQENEKALSLQVSFY